MISLRFRVYLLGTVFSIYWVLRVYSLDTSLDSVITVIIRPFVRDFVDIFGLYLFL